MNTWMSTAKVVCHIFSAISTRFFWTKNVDFPISQNIANKKRMFVVIHKEHKP